MFIINSGFSQPDATFIKSRVTVSPDTKRKSRKTDNKKMSSKPNKGKGIFIIFYLLHIDFNNFECQF